jgi:hypothetical protein
VTTGDALVAEAQRFAANLTATIRSVVGGHVEVFRARTLHRPGIDHVSVRQEPRTGIPLTVDGTPLLNLTAEYYCIWDSPGHFLAVDESAVKVYAGATAAGEPLFRYEYTRATTGDVPGAHVQIHGHRDALAFVMTRAGGGSPRGQQLAGRVAQGSAVPRMSDLHFPVGEAGSDPVWRTSSTCWSENSAWIIKTDGEMPLPMGASGGAACKHQPWCGTHPTKPSQP